MHGCELTSANLFQCNLLSNWGRTRWGHNCPQHRHARLAQSALGWNSHRRSNCRSPEILGWVQHEFCRDLANKMAFITRKLFSVQCVNQFEAIVGSFDETVCWMTGDEKANIAKKVLRGCDRMSKIATKINVTCLERHPPSTHSVLNSENGRSRHISGHRALC